MKVNKGFFVGLSGFFVVLAVFLALFFAATTGYSEPVCTPAVMLQDNNSVDPPTNYTTIQEAYDAAILSEYTDITIKLAAGTFEENLSFNASTPISVVLDGGYDDDCTYVTKSSTTGIIGSITISTGTVIFSNIGIQSLTTCEFIDLDGDSYSDTDSCGISAEDCDVNNANTHPGAFDTPDDGIDQDCSGQDLNISADVAICSICHPMWNSTIYGAHSNFPTPDNSCVGCHMVPVSNIIVGHNDRTVRTDGNNMSVGSIINCWSCHDGHDPDYWVLGGTGDVRGKMLADKPNYTCDTCHETETRAALHATATAHNNRIISTACGVCHTSDTTTKGSPGTGRLTTAANVDTLHRSDCTLCHSYTGTKVNPAIVRQAIKDGMSGTLITCLTCHTDKADHGGIPTSGKHPKHFELMGESCIRCHENIPHFKSGTDSNGDGWYDLAETDVCDSCHQDADGNPPPGFKEGWHNDSYDLSCDGCHDGRPYLDENVISSNAHDPLVSEYWIRHYPCYYCHDKSVNADYDLTSNHSNGLPDVDITAKWNKAGQADPIYDYDDKNCSNTYCHSDGTVDNPKMRAYPWDGGRQDCNACHGHNETDDECIDCHLEDAKHTWTPEKKWLSAMPMYENTGVGSTNSNSHIRHLFTGYSCDECHVNTVVGSCVDCHKDDVLPVGAMREDGHVFGEYHVNKFVDVAFKDTNDGNASYDDATQTCSGTACHTGAPPRWGGSVSNTVTCMECHFTSGADVDSIDQPQGKINETQWNTRGHGKKTGTYEFSNNPAAAFPGTGCWYCHDNTVLHQTDDNPYRLRRHEQYQNRFDKECAYCHMLVSEAECLRCHNTAESLAIKLTDIGAEPGINPPYTQEQPDHSGYVDGNTSCLTSECHVGDTTRHKTDSGVWTQDQNEDVENSYLMMGVCLVCHDDDTNNQCTSCHFDDPETPEDESAPYVVGFDPELPGSTFIYPTQAKASSFHFGYKHYTAYEESVATTLDTGDVSATVAYSLDTGTVSVTAVSSWELEDSTKTWTAITFTTGSVSIDASIATELDDTGQTWTVDQWSGRTVLMTSGVNIGESRAITRNTVTKLTLLEGFSNPVESGDSYEIYVDKWSGKTVLMTSGVNNEESRRIHGNTETKLTLESGFTYPVEIGDSYEIIDPEALKVLTSGGKTWTVDEWAGRTVMMTGGGSVPVINKEGREIKSNTATTLTLKKGFTNPVEIGDSYKIVDPVWKGGKFCWDCHDPHGDNNLYMIQDRVATRTDGQFGIPLDKEVVDFTSAYTGSDYARSEAPYDGLCNVCHTSGSQYYTSTYGDGSHHATKRCTECHEHRFTDSHSGGAACNSCHENKPVPRHTGFGLPRDCTKCHADVIGLRMNVMTQMQSKSHHAQRADGTISNMDCYQCHWEADEHGLVDNDHHEGYNTKTHVSIKSGDTSDPKPYVDLVIWTGEDPDEDGFPTGSDDNKTVGSRPIVYDPDGTDPDGPGVQTVTQFLASNVTGEGLAAQRAEVDSITDHCLGCHSDQNNDSVPFDDCKTPRQYAWDRSSIGARYSNLTTTPWGKNSGSNVADKSIMKAFSAHGNAVNNGGGFHVDDGEDETITNTRDGLGGTRNYNVQCFDCHSSHGSKVAGKTSSYTTFNGSQNGGNLKETQAGKGGYIYDYYASENPNSTSINPYKAGSGQCFDCHESADVGTSVSLDTKTPWGYNETFGATAAILSFRDSLRFGQSDRGKSDIFSYKRTAILGGHHRASNKNEDSTNYDDADMAYSLGTGTVSDSATLITELTDSTKTWIVDEWVGKTVMMTSGVNDGESSPIVSNTETVLTLEPDFTYEVDSGDFYKIVAPFGLDSGTVSATATFITELTDSTKTWTVDEWVGKTVMMTSGVNNGESIQIVSNTATELTLEPDLDDLVDSGDFYKIIDPEAAGPIGGLCTPCHDPHGVSPTLGDNMEYGVPLLKGTWMSSPYKEDVAPLGTSYFRDYLRYDVYPMPPHQKADGRAPGGWRTDRNTFNTTSLSVRSDGPKEYDRITQDPETFAGLCLRCHPKSSLIDEEPKNTAFKTVDRIHESVMGWGDNEEHSFTCSKCHSVHVSALPRLMKTNCLDFKHRNRVPSGGLPSEYSGNYFGKFPFGRWAPGQFNADSTSTCHGAATANGSGGWPANQTWNNVTPW